MLKFKNFTVFILTILFQFNILNAQNNINKCNETQLKELKNCLHKKIKYPFFMQIQKLEGRVFVLLNINKKGNVTNIKVETDYFGKIYEIEKFTNEKRIEKLRSKIENRLVPLFNDCCQNIVFCIPETNNEDTIRIPVSFGTYDDFDDLGINDDFDDYDYNDDFDYHYFDYD